jgi:hypothetical protein
MSGSNLVPEEDMQDLVPNKNLVPEEDLQDLMPQAGGMPAVTKGQRTAMQDLLDRSHNALYGMAGRGEEMFAGLTEKLQSPEYMQKIAAQREWRKNTPGAEFGGMGTDAIASLLPTLKYPKMAGLIGSGMSGYMQGFATKPGTLQERADQGMESGIGGVVGSAIPGALSKVFGGVPLSAEAKTLIKEGVQPTVGQAIEQKTGLGGIVGSGVSRLESASQSLPFSGAATRHARNRAMDNWEQSTIKMAEDPDLGITAGGMTGSDGISHLYHKGFKPAYKDSLSGQSVPVTPRLFSDIHIELQNPNLFMTNEARNETRNFLESQFRSIKQIPGPGSQTATHYSAQDLHDIESNIAGHARKLIGSQDKNQRGQGQLLDNIEEALAKYRRDFLPPYVAQKVGRIDDKYAIYKHLEKASGTLSADAGHFTPTHLLSVEKRMDPSKDKGAFGRGEALMQQWAQAGKTVLHDTVGVSSAPSRSMFKNALTLPGVIGTGIEGGVLSHPAIWVPYGGIATALAAGSTKPVQKILTGGGPTQKRLAELLDKIGKPVGKSLGVGLSLNDD